MLLQRVGHGELLVLYGFVLALVVIVLITPLIFLKSALFFGLLAGFRVCSRTSFFASLNLTNYSEFGLIVAAIGTAGGRCHQCVQRLYGGSAGFAAHVLSEHTATS